MLNDHQDAVTVTTPRCLWCLQAGTVRIPRAELEHWIDDPITPGVALAQDAFPSLSPAEREQLITGTHPACWDAMFPDEDDDDPEAEAV